MPIVTRGITKSGQKFIIRYPVATDLLSLWRYFNRLSAEKTFITFQGEKLKKTDEAKWIDTKIKGVRQRKLVVLFVIVNGQVAGICDVTLKPRVNSHVGSMGITLAPELRGQGVGKLLMTSAIAQAQQRLPGLKMLTLECFANNPVALSLYRSLGFIEFGRLPSGLHRLGEYIDEVYMYRPLS